MIDQSTHIVLNVLVSEGETTKSSNDRTSINSTAWIMSHYWTGRCAISPIVRHQMTVFVNRSGTPWLRIRHIRTVFINNSTVYKRKFAGMVFSMKLRRYSKTFVVRMFNAFMMTTNWMIRSSFWINLVYHYLMRRSTKNIIVYILGRIWHLSGLYFIFIPFLAQHFSLIWFVQF